MENSVFVPMKILNEARHQALEDLKEKLLRKYRRNVGDERVKRIAEETPAKIRDVVLRDNVPRKKEEYIPVYVSCESSLFAQLGTVPIQLKEDITAIAFPSKPFVASSNAFRYPSRMVCSEANVRRKEHLFVS